jgi:hypothetical protein
MHVNIRRLLPKFVIVAALAHSANPDVLAVSESLLRKATKNSEVSIPDYKMFCQERTAKELQSTAEIACRVLSYYPGLCPISSGFYRNC